MKQKICLAFALLLLVFTAVGCGDQDVDEVDNPQDSGEAEDELIIEVILGEKSAEVSATDCEKSEYEGEEAYAIRDIIELAELTETPEDYFYDFIGEDGFSPTQKGALLLTWPQLADGYLVFSTGRLMFTMDSGIEKTYNVKLLAKIVLETEQITVEE